tara:strand:+ start:902 stop:1474 length:573 start_codon:yes stop_codon:yes gene_type:complete
MFVKKFAKIFLIILLFLVIFYLIFVKYFKTKEIKNIKNQNEDISYNSNILKDIEYKTKDKDGNDYLIRALEGEIDFSNPNILFLTNVSALIKLNTSEIVTITSDYGKYNSENNDTIFSKNVIVNYLDNKITAEYIDFSLEKNLMLISRNVVYSNPENSLKADVVEIDIKTRDTKIFMYEKDKKVNIKSNN